MELRIEHYALELLSLTDNHLVYIHVLVSAMQMRFVWPHVKMVNPVSNSLQYSLDNYKRLYTYHRIVAVLPIGRVLDDLRSAVGQLNTIFAARHVTIADRIVIVVVGRFRIVYGILEVEWHAGLVVMLLSGRRDSQDGQARKGRNAQSDGIERKECNEMKQKNGLLACRLIKVHRPGACTYVALLLRLLRSGRVARLLWRRTRCRRSVRLLGRRRRPRIRHLTGLLPGRLLGELDGRLLVVVALVGRQILVATVGGANVGQHVRDAGEDALFRFGLEEEKNIGISFIFHGEMRSVLHV